MFLYIDDDSVDRVLIQRLTDSGYKTLTPSLAGTAGQADPVHFMCAIRAGSVVLTRDYDDFKLLHDLVLLDGGHHPGILNNPGIAELVAQTVAASEFGFF